MWEDLSFKERADLINQWHKEHVIDYASKKKEYDETHRFDDGGGTNPMNYEWRGTIYDDNLKNQGITHVAELPEVVVTGKSPKRPYFSSYDPMALYKYGVEPALEGAGKVLDLAMKPADYYFDAATSPAWWINKAITGNDDNTVQSIRDWTHTAMRDAGMLLSPTRDIGTLRTGFKYAPWNPENPGIAGSDETGQAMNNVFDIMLSPLGPKAASTVRPRARAAIYNNVTPWSYKDDAAMGTYKIRHGQELKDAAKEFLTPGHIDTYYPKWRQRFDEHMALHPEEASQGGITLDYDYFSRPSIMEFRDHAWAKAMRQPYNPRLAQDNIYLYNGDGTYSYDLNAVDRIRKKHGLGEFSGEISEHSKGPQYGFEDSITDNGGGVNIRKTPEGLYRMTDVWDIAPLQFYLDNWISKLPMSLQDVLKTEKGRKIVNKIKNMDVVKPLGGDPFTLDMTWDPNDPRFFEYVED